MSAKTRLYTKRAKDCMAEAEQAHPDEKALLLEIAESWLRLAHMASDEKSSSCGSQPKVNLNRGRLPIASSGIAHSDLKIGMLVTVSSNKRTGDRALVNAIWEIAGLNEAHVLLVCQKDRERSNYQRLIVPLAEYKFYSAEAMGATFAQSSSRMN